MDDEDLKLQNEALRDSLRAILNVDAYPGHQDEALDEIQKIAKDALAGKP